MCQVLIILVVIVCLATTGSRQTAWALSPIQINLVEISVATMAGSVAAYYIWKNNPAERAKGYPENLGLGEWYVAAYSGLPLLPSADWTLSHGFNPSLNGGPLSVSYKEAAILGGVKFGRYYAALVRRGNGDQFPPACGPAPDLQNLSPPAQRRQLPEPDQRPLLYLGHATQPAGSLRLPEG